MKIDESCLYTNTHEWIKINGNKALVGISDYAQGQLGDIVFVDMPDSGREVTQGEETAVVESVKGVGTVYAPIAGTVTRSNDDLAADPAALNKDAFAAWIFELEIDPNTDTSEFLSPATYAESCTTE